MLTGTTVWTKAAFGENVPANPPLSFQPTICPVPYAPPLIRMPRSWLTPTCAVHRSALPDRTASELVFVVKPRLRVVAPIGCQFVPLLPVRVDCCQLIAGGPSIKLSPG